MISSGFKIKYQNIEEWQNLESIWDFYPKNYYRKYFTIISWKFSCNCGNKVTEIKAIGSELSDRIKEFIKEEAQCAKTVGLKVKIRHSTSKEIVPLKLEVFKIN